MDSVALWILGMDKLLFAWVRETFGNPVFDYLSVYLSNIYFWTPALVFLMVSVLMIPQKAPALNLLYGLGAVVLSYQAAFLLMQIVGQPAPYVIEMITERASLPVSPPDSYVFSNFDFSFPDWEMAALTALLMFSKSRLRINGQKLSIWFWVMLMMVGFMRVLSGHAYPYDIAAGWLLGRMVGWLMVMFARNMDIVLNPQKEGLNTTVREPSEESTPTGEA